MRKAGVWRICLFVLFALAAVGGIVWHRVHGLTEQQWATMQARVAELQRENESRTYERPVLRGKAVAGNAWDDYAAAGAGALRIKTTYDLLSYVRGDYPKDPPSKAAAVAGPYLAALERLQRGAQRAASQPGLSYYHAMNPRMTLNQGTSVLPWVGMIQARTLIEEGHPGDAVDVWLDLFQFGRDSADGTNQETEYTALYMLDYLTLELRTALMKNKIPATVAVDLDRGLEILDRGWPSRRRLLDNHLLALGLGLTAEVEGDALIYQGRETRTLRSWRWMVSARLRAARTFHFCDVLTVQLYPTDPAAAWSAAREWPEPVVWDTFEPLMRTGSSAALSRLRLLRIAAHFLASGDVLDLQSGTDRPIQATLEGKALRIVLPDPKAPDDGNNDNWWYAGKPIVLRVVRSP